MAYPANIPRGTPTCKSVNHVVAESPPNLSIHTGKYTNMNTWNTPVKNLLTTANQNILLATNRISDPTRHMSPIIHISFELTF